MANIIRLLMIVAITCNLYTPTLAAADTADYTAGTQVEYAGTGSEQYTITVPASLSPGESGNVTLAGTWATNRMVSVTAQETVTLINSINANDTKDLAVTFPGIEKVGSNIEAQTFTEAVSVANIENALFGTWDGTFCYNVEICDSNEATMISFTLKGVTYQAEEGMTWAEWCDSDYNTAGLYYGSSVRFEGSFEGVFENNGYTLVSPSDVIMADHQYIASSGGGAFPIS